MEISSITSTSNPFDAAPIKACGASSKIRGFVTTDLEGNNFYPYSFAMQDGFSSDAAGITVALAQTQPDFVRGDEVEIELEGATLKRNEDGVLVLTPAKAPVKTQTTTITVEPMD